MYLYGFDVKCSEAVLSEQNFEDLSMDVVVTDLTHLHGTQVCLAAMTLDGTRCIRPIRRGGGSPNFEFEELKERDIVPGRILQADFTPKHDATPPHIEDCYFDKLKATGYATPEDFHDMLGKSSYHSLKDGFGVPIEKKMIPRDLTPARSIITLKSHPGNFELTLDKFKENKLRAHVKDADGFSARYLAVNDLLTTDRVSGSDSVAESVKKFNDFSRKQEGVYIRVGIGRLWRNEEGAEGYWLQVNGIYTFPDYLQEMRSY